MDALTGAPIREQARLKGAFLGAWSAIACTSLTDDEADGVSHLRRGLEAAVRGGNDTDTVAAIAGALLGAQYGASAVPEEWRLILHGWPGRRGEDLIAMALRMHSDYGPARG
ncbi:MAG: hypothetical protein E6Q90_13910 [Actinobacteria bacterium]|nr:MAG: hypothetical protein E6Q90_13910 [Actinomycetota bacterium]